MSAPSNKALATTAAIPTAVPSEMPATSAKKGSDGDCGFTGSGDMYGVGVRLGVYIQSATAKLSGLILENGAERSRSPIVPIVFCHDNSFHPWRIRWQCDGAGNTYLFESYRRRGIT